MTLSDTTAGAAIYYTTNGATPTTSSSLYTGPITVATTTTIKAIASAAGYSTSAVAVATYTIQPAAATPTLSPAGGSYTTAKLVTLADSTAGAKIYYTIDGSAPNTTTTLYSGPIPVAATTTIKAMAVALGFGPSSTATATYTIVAATPTFLPAPGTYYTPQSVTLADATPGAILFFTTDGSVPTTLSTRYTGAITVGSTTTIRAIAVAPGYGTSATATGR